MICPECGKRASSFRRYTFSKQGVSISQNTRGYLTCQHCGILLRVVRFGKQMWIYFFASVGILAVFTIFFKKLIALIGVGLFSVLWVCLAAAIMFIYTVGLWKYGILEKTEINSASSAP
jgi:hypothetical protein